jgi:hypothetical protein
MFRFSIRELMLVMLIAVLGVAWFLEHRRAQAALLKASESAAELRQTTDDLYDALNQLPQFGLNVDWVVGGGPLITKRQSDEDG